MNMLVRYVACFLCFLCVVVKVDKIPVVLDTDLGSDIDDTWALLYLLKSPELDLKMVLTDTADTTYRAQVTAKYLEACGRSDVAIGIGKAFKPDAEFQKPYIENYALENYPGVVHEDGISAFIELVHASEEPITLICIGPVPNIAEALTQDPSIAKRIHFIGMHGSVDVGYNRAAEPSAEWNVASNIPAFRTVLAADWLSMKITPLDTCGHVILEGENYQSVKKAELPELVALFENYRYWVELVTWERPDYYELRSSNLYDIVPVYMAYDGKWLDCEDLKLVIDDEGFMRRSEEGYPVSAALDWNDLEAFYDHFTERLLEGDR